ncbi:recombinase family protein [Tyzzerella sp. OttesenSCG-928-J15]|nr:recombinase family protein [Tyzzerella sp. OttesenSCG-928-J15]
MKNKKQLRAVAYCRFSSDMQREESIDAQLRAIEDYCKRNNILLISEYIDRAKSATTDNRPEFLKMIKDAQQGDFDIVIVHKLDRFARNRYDSAHYKHQLKRYGVSIRSVVENLDDSPESIIMESVLEGMAEYYSKNLAREVMKGMKENALNCVHTGGTPPLGYDVDKDTKKLIINEHEAVAVRLIYQRFLECVGYGEIIHELNSLGFKGKRGQVFAKNSLHSILKNPKYAGDYVYNRSMAKDIDGKRSGYKDKDEWIIMPDAIPAIISREDFEAVQERLKQRMLTRKHSQAKEEYILKGKMFCGICGGAYVGARRRRSKDGTFWTAYGCNKRYRSKKEGCNNKEVSKAFIEQFIFERLAEYVFNDDYIPLITDEYNEHLKHQTGDIANQLRSLQAKLKAVDIDLDKISDILIKTDSMTLVDKLNKLEEEKADIKRTIAKLTHNNKITEITEEDIKTVFERIRELLKSGKLTNIKLIVETYINKIEVFPDKVIVFFNFFPNITIKGCAYAQPSKFAHQHFTTNADDSPGEGGI